MTMQGSAARGRLRHYGTVFAAMGSLVCGVLIVTLPAYPVWREEELERKFQV